MFLGLMIGQQEISMERIMDLPLHWKVQLVHSWSNDLNDFKWTISLRLQFDCWMGSLEISTLQSDLLAFLIRLMTCFTP
jgi:hypothetical protein